MKKKEIQKGGRLRRSAVCCLRDRSPPASSAPSSRWPSRLLHYSAPTSDNLRERKPRRSQKRPSRDRCSYGAPQPPDPGAALFRPRGRPVQRPPRAAEDRRRRRHTGARMAG